MTPEEAKQFFYDYDKKLNKEGIALIRKNPPMLVTGGAINDNRVGFRMNLELLEAILDLNETSTRLSKIMIGVGIVGVFVTAAGVAVAVVGLLNHFAR